MGTYTVKSGDTLSGIGASQGVDWKSITGYKSGNPNLIYPGETLTWGQPAPSTPTPAQAPAQAPVSTPVAQPVANTPVAGSSQALTGELTNLDNTTQNPIDIYNAALEKAGIVDARTRVTSLRKSLMDNQNLLDNLSGNISGRTANSLVTEAQRQRLLASESTPIIDAGNKLNQGLSLAQGDYNTITDEAKTTTDLTVAGNQAKRIALLDRLKLAIDNETDVETKRKWQAEYDRQVALDAEATAQDTRDYNYKVGQDAITNSLNQQKSASVLVLLAIRIPKDI